MYDDYNVAMTDDLPYDGTFKGDGLDSKRAYLERDWNLVRDNVEFTKDVDPEDFKSMEVLRWL